MGPTTPMRGCAFNSAIQRVAHSGVTARVVVQHHDDRSRRAREPLIHRVREALVAFVLWQQHDAAARRFRRRHASRDVLGRAVVDQDHFVWPRRMGLDRSQTVTRQFALIQHRDHDADQRRVASPARPSARAPRSRGTPHAARVRRPHRNPCRGHRPPSSARRDELDARKCARLLACVQAASHADACCDHVR